MSIKLCFEKRIRPEFALKKSCKGVSIRHNNERLRTLVRHLEQLFDQSELKRAVSLNKRERHTTVD